MIIGNGDIAKAILPLSIARNKKILFFVSGVSNSSEKKEAEYRREKTLLLKQPKNMHLVYVSSLCIFYSNSRYAKHKKQMEKLIKKTFKKHTIIRLGNITWGKNPHTFINYMKNAKKEGKKFEVWDTYRYIVSKKEFQYWISLIPPFSCEMNIPGKRLTVKQVVKRYVK